MLETFVRQVWGGGDGHFATSYGAPGSPSNKHWWPRSVAELMELLKRAEVRRDVHVHWALARFRTRRRTNAEAVSVSSVAVDVDADASDPAVRAQVAELAELVSPPSWVVHSGRGLHLYWTLTRPAAVEEWRRLAIAVREAVGMFDLLRSDTAGIAAPARTLRVPGSWNPRRGCRARLLGNGTHEPYELDALMSRVEPFAAAAVDVGSSDSPPPKFRDPGVLLARCRPVAAMSGGDHSYEAWFAAARLFAWCEDVEAGRKAFHEFSRRHPDYNPGDTNAKFDNALETAQMPPTCERLRALAGCDCSGCPLARAGKGMPTRLEQSLGVMGRVEAVGAGASIEGSGRGGSDDACGASEAPAGLPSDPIAERLDDALEALEDRRRAMDGWRPLERGSMVEDRLKLLLQQYEAAIAVDPGSGAMLLRGDANKRPEVLSNYTFFVLERSEPDYQGMALLVAYVRRRDAMKLPRTGDALDTRLSRYKFRAADWEYRLIVIPPGELKDRYTPARVLRALTKRDLMVSAATTKRANLLRAWLDRQLFAVREAKSGELRHGWTSSEGFNLGDVFISRDGLVAYNPFSTVFDPDGLVRPSGRVFEARKAARTLLDALSDEARPLFWLLLGAPLMKLAPQPAVLAYVSGPSGIGKSALGVALQYLYSDPGGRPSAMTGHDTMLSVFRTVGVLKNLPAVIDELTAMRRNHAQELVINLTQGRERHRMKSDGSGMRPGEDWSTVVLATTNTPVVDVVRPMTDVGMAEVARVIDYSPSTLWRRLDAIGDVLRGMAASPGVLGTELVTRALMAYGRVKSVIAEESGRHDLFDAGGAGDVGRYWRVARAVSIAAMQLMALPLGLDPEVEAAALDAVMQDRFRLAVDSAVGYARSAAMRVVRRASRRCVRVVRTIGGKAAVEFPSVRGTLVTDPDGVIVADAGATEVEIVVSESALAEALRREFPAEHADGRVDLGFLLNALGGAERKPLFELHVESEFGGDVDLAFSGCVRMTIPLAKPAKVVDASPGRFIMAA